MFCAATAVTATKAYVAAGGGTKIVEGLLSANGTGTVDELDMAAAYTSVIISGTNLHSVCRLERLNPQIPRPGMPHCIRNDFLNATENRFGTPKPAENKTES